MKNLIFTVCCLAMVLGVFSLSYADRVVFQPGSSQGKDMWLSSYYNNTAVDDNKLQVGGWGDWYRTFIEFDLTDLPETATSAYMYMYSYPRGDSSTPVSMGAYLLTTSWDEQTQDYYDSLSGYSLGTLSAPTPNSWYGLNITGIYNGWKDETYVNNGFVFLSTGNNNQFNMFRSSDYSDFYYRPMMIVNYDGANLGFPLAGDTPYTAPISAVFDHSVSTGFNCPDGVVTAYTNERGESQHGVSDWSTENYCDDEQDLYGFAQNGTVPFSINGQYDSPDPYGDDVFLFYDGHTGYDYPADEGTYVYSAAAGYAVPHGDDGDAVKITHPSGYDTYYLHLDSISIGNGQSVLKGAHIGDVELNHLHFTVKKSDGTRVDPYGWKGEYGEDPLQIDGNDNLCLWDSCQ